MRHSYAQRFGFVYFPRGQHLQVVQRRSTAGAAKLVPFLAFQDQGSPGAAIAAGRDFGRTGNDALLCSGSRCI